MHRYRKSAAAAVRAIAGSGVQRRGAVILEFILVFPVVFIATLAIFEFGILALVMQTGTTAAIEGARKGAAAFPNGTPLDSPGGDNDVADAVMATMNRFLLMHNLQIGSSTGILQMTLGSSGPVERGSVPGYSPTALVPIPGQVQVRLCFPLVSANGPIPDWLAPYGFSVENAKFEMTTTAILE